MSDFSFDADEYAGQRDAMEHFRGSLEDLTEYAVARAAVSSKKVLEWSELVPQLAAEFRMTKAAGFSDDQAMTFLYARHLSR